MASVKSVIRQQIKEEYGFRCQLCFQKFPENQLQIHHIRTRTTGGNNHFYNLICLDQVCHMKVHRFEITHNKKGKRLLYLPQNRTQIKITIKVTI